MQIGYKLAAEGFGPKELIRQAVLAEQAGFDFVEMSDHYHPWLEAQGHSAFTWNLAVRHRHEDRTDRPGHRRDLPVGALPPGHHRPGRDPGLAGDRGGGQRPGVGEPLRMLTPAAPAARKQP